MLFLTNIDQISVKVTIYRDADRSLARPGRKQARKHVMDARDFRNMETRAVTKFFFLPARQGAEGNSLHCDSNIRFFLPCRAKDLSAPLFFVPES
jgi:hypothetical protein